MSEENFEYLFVKTLTGKTIAIKNDIGPSDLVETLKYRIYDIEGIPPDRLTLVTRGRELKDNQKTLAEYYV